jgi:hypothetical protein
MALPIVNSSRYSVTVPSTGQEVEFRPFLVKEEKILMVAMESKDNKMMIKALKDILKACIFDDIDINKLTSFDLEELFLRLRSKSVGESVNLQLKCEECKALTPIEINLDNIKMTELPKDKHVMVTKDIGIEFEYPSLDTVSKMEYNPEKTSPDKQMKLTLQLITRCMKSIFNSDEVWDCKNQTEKELNDFIEGLSSEQFAKITEFFSSLPTLKHKVEFSCITCKHEQELTLEGVQSFFI